MGFSSKNESHKRFSIVSGFSFAETGNKLELEAENGPQKRKSET